MKASDQNLSESSHENSYRLAKTEWTQRYSAVITSRDNYQRLAFGATAVSLVAVAGCIYLGTIPKSVPFVIQMDRGGNVAAIGTAQQSNLSSTQWDSIKKLAIENFVQSWRSVTLDSQFQKTLWDRAYLYVGKNSPANKFLDEWYQQHNPDIRARTEVVSTRIISSGPASDNTFQVWWEESISPLNGGEPRTEQWRVTLPYTVLGVPAKLQPGDPNPFQIRCTQIWLAPVNSEVK